MHATDYATLAQIIKSCLSDNIEQQTQLLENFSLVLAMLKIPRVNVPPKSNPSSLKSGYNKWVA